MDQNGLLNGNDIAVAGSTVAVLCTGEGLVSPAAMTGVPIGASPPSPDLQVTAPSMENRRKWMGPTRSRVRSDSSW